LAHATLTVILKVHLGILFTTEYKDEGLCLLVLVLNWPTLLNNGEKNKIAEGGYSTLDLTHA
jgi:hypothetical protein